MQSVQLFEDETGYRLVDAERNVDTRLHFADLAPATPLGSRHFVDGSHPAVISFDSIKGLHRIDWVYPFETRVHTWWVGPKGRRRAVANLDTDERLALFQNHGAETPLLRVKEALLRLEQGDHSGAQSVLSTVGSDPSADIERLFAHAAILWRGGVLRASAQEFDDLVGAIMDRRDFSDRKRSLLLRKAAEVLTHAWPKRRQDETTDALRAAALKATAMYQHEAHPAEISDLLNDRVKIEFHDLRDHIDRFTHQGINAQRDFLLEFSCGDLSDARVILFDRTLASPARPATGIVQTLHFLRRYLTSPAHYDRVSAAIGDNRFAKRSVILQTGDNVLDQIGSVGFGRRAEYVNVQAIPDAHYFSTHAYASLRAQIDAHWTAWADRENLAYWRGSTTGVGLTEHNITAFPRYDLCRLSVGRGDLLDARIVSVIASNPELKAKAEDLYRSEGVLGDRVPEIGFMNYKMNVVVDGNVNAWGLWGKMLMGSAVLLVESAWRQWYYEDLEPWVHYVPVKADFSDLFERIEWCRAHDAEAEEIGRNGRAFTLARTFDSQMLKGAFTMLEASRPL